MWIHNPNDNIWVNITFHQESERERDVMRLSTPGFSVYTDMQNMSVSMAWLEHSVLLYRFEEGWGEGGERRKVINRARYLRVFSYEFCGHNPLKYISSIASLPTPTHTPPSPSSTQ